MKIQNGSIIPGISISGIKLGITKKEILKIIEGNYQEEILKRGSIIIIENAKFWIAEDGKVDQIGVEGDFQGKYEGIIGLGSTLCDVKEKIGNYIQIYDTYELENIKGICFELEDIEDWDQLKAPIDHIYVFRIT
ncbi:MAG: hypothetical protein HFG78_12145 [Hungatella sp.]|jgi:hypothetical protein|nr:hypothetical protein [Hungatella sp.]MCI9503366.1 hypothetical protein [Hungatella sp.]